MLDPRTAAADRALTTLAGRVDLLLDVSPVNAEAAWDASVAAGHRAELDLRYRPVGTDVTAVRRDLAALDLDALDDDGLRHLLTDRRRELDGQARLIEARGTPAFLARSLDVYGTADDRLADLARRVLARLPPPPDPEDLVGPGAFARRAGTEIERYRAQDPGLRASVSVRDDVPGLMVVQRELLVGTDAWIPAHRQEALVHHEVGVHLLTAVTGGRQPLHLLEQGLAGSEETQEALGVLAEHLVGGVDVERVRTLAARALAARRLSDGARFPALFAELHEEHRVAEHAAWTIVMRVVRGGGFTKDVIYLRGLVELVDHLAAGGALDPLLVGKVHLRHVPALEQLLADGVLAAPSLRPHWLDGDGPAARLAAIRRGEAPVAGWP